jgi:hypothetical protein
MTTHRERREARAERLRDWAEKRQTNAEATLEADRPLTSDHAYNTQPGHIPGRDRVIARQDRAYASLDKADRMKSRADGIENQLANAIYSDDDDATARLRERITSLEAERDRIKAYNATCRKGHPDTSILTAEERAELLSTARHSPYMLGKGGQFPAYHLTNLGGNITRNRKRLAALEAAARTAPEGE